MYPLVFFVEFVFYNRFADVIVLHFQYIVNANSCRHFVRLS